MNRAVLDLAPEKFRPDVVVYHGGCHDGWTAAWLLARKFPDATLLPAVYGNDDCLSDVRFRLADDGSTRVLFVDYALPRGDMDYLAMRSTLLVLDHHATAAVRLDGAPYAYIDIERSGCELAWDWLHNKLEDGSEHRPWLVQAAGDRDLWRPEMIPELSALVAATEHTAAGWDRLNSYTQATAEYLGKFPLGLQREYVRATSAHSYLEEIDGVRPLGAAVNAPYWSSSELCAHLMKTRDVPWAAAWFRRGDGRFQVSLRSAGDVDVEAIALRHGGGGHTRAAGYVGDRLPFRED